MSDNSIWHIMVEPDGLPERQPMRSKISLEQQNYLSSSDDALPRLYCIPLSSTEYSWEPYLFTSLVCTVFLNEVSPVKTVLSATPKTIGDKPVKCTNSPEYCGVMRQKTVTINYHCGSLP